MFHAKTLAKTIRGEKRTRVTGVIAVIVAIAAGLASGPRAVAEEERTIRALLVTGGGWHDFPAQTEIIIEGLNERLGNIGVGNIEWTIENEAENRPDFEPARFEDTSWIEEFDLVIHNHSISRVEDQESLTERIAGAHRDSGVPAVLIHGTMHFGRQVDQWHDFTGVVTRSHKDLRPREVRNLAPEHPIMQEFGETWTPAAVELYRVESLRSGVKPLADCYDEPSGNRHVVIWTHQYGEAPIFGTTLGHDNRLVEDPLFLDTLARGIRWALQEREDR